MKTVYFVRHGQTEGNIGTFYQGFDTPLTDVGLEQAQSVADRCSRINFDVLIASTMTRAQQTADCISKITGKEVVSSDLFVERLRPSVLIGKKIGDPETDRLEQEWASSLLHTGNKVNDGENFSEIISRANAAINYIESRSEESLLVVTHGYFLRVLIANILFGENITGEELARVIATFRTNNTGITVFANETDYGGQDSRWRIRVFNDHAHLG